MSLVKAKEPITVTNARYRQHYHLQTPGGWLNDPNGLCYFQVYYHVFYQYHPYSAEWGPMHWGHARSQDLLHWEDLPMALTPGDPEDTGGCFSGSAIVKDNRLYLIYTGHHYYDDGDQDHFWENQNVAYSDDGIHFTKYAGNPVIEAPDDNGQDFRDPKVWAHDGQYYLIVGSQAQPSRTGRVLLYQSADLFNWQLLGPITIAQSIDSEGFMWECPDLFHLNGQDTLVFSPMGIAAQGHDFLNLNQVASVMGNLDYSHHALNRGSLYEIDHGHNFYAPQSFLAPDGRQMMYGWMSSFDDPYPEQADGWCGCLTVPREYVIKNHHLGMIPVAELAQLRQQTIVSETIQLNHPVTIAYNDAQHAELDLTLEHPQNYQWRFRNQDQVIMSLTFDPEQNEFNLDRPHHGGKRYVTITPQPTHHLQIIIDTSSVEIFINDGEACFTERYYIDEAPSVILSAREPTKAQLAAYQLGIPD